MDLVLQIWGGLFYLTNKICFALGEKQNLWVAVFYDYERQHGNINGYSEQTNFGISAGCIIMFCSVRLQNSDKSE